jgi:hypothetical protein
MLLLYVLLLFSPAFPTAVSYFCYSFFVFDRILGEEKKGRKNIPQSFTVHFHHALGFSFRVAIVTAVEIWNSERGHFSVSSTDCMCLA